MVNIFCFLFKKAQYFLTASFFIEQNLCHFYMYTDGLRITKL